MSEHPESTPQPPAARGPLFYFGATALLAATAVDALAVAGRHFGLPVLGSLELVQAAILLASSSALVSATLAGRHANARLLLQRLRPAALRYFQRLNTALTFIFFVTLAAGQIWIALDLWNGHEDSELLHIPFAPLRIVSIAAALAAAVITARKLIGKSSP